MGILTDRSELTDVALNDWLHVVDVSNTTDNAAGSSRKITIQNALKFAPLITSGSGAPATTPSKVGNVYIDTTAPAFYYAKGTASSADWVSLSGGGGGGAGITWAEVTGTTQAAAVNYGYIANNASRVTITLPDTAPLGSIVEIVGKGAGGWKIAQNAGETVYMGVSQTTAGVSGYIQSTLSRDVIRLVCITANTEWNAIPLVGEPDIV